MTQSLRSIEGEWTARHFERAVGPLLRRLCYLQGTVAGESFAGDMISTHGDDHYPHRHRNSVSDYARKVSHSHPRSNR